MIEIHRLLPANVLQRQKVWMDERTGVILIMPESSPLLKDARITITITQGETYENQRT